MLLHEALCKPSPLQVTFKVWRGNAAKTLSMVYKLTPPLAIPNVVEGALSKQSFHIVGGLVFSPLTQNYVSTLAPHPLPATLHPHPSVL